MFFNELDLLEIRLNILDPYVDYFVIGESCQTFSGKEKPLYLKENIERFTKWEKKIRYIEIRPLEEKYDSPFQRAAFQKDMLRMSLYWTPGIEDEDVVYFGDLDEIWKPKVITDDKVYNLQQLNYCYYLNNRSSENWVGTIVGRWKTVKDQTFNDWRANHVNELPDGGWHFTNMGGLEQIKKKLDAYDHQEYNNDEVKTLLEDRIKYGEDYVGRNVDWQGKPFEFSVSDVDLPKYILDNKTKYGHLFK